MVAEIYNPNFPPHLNIQPSVIASFAKESKTLGNQFGSAAQEDAIRRYGIAGRVWEAAYATVLYIQPPEDVEFDPPFLDVPEGPRIESPAGSMILELGSGTGIVAATLLNVINLERDHIIATDLPEVCPLIEKNLFPEPALANPSKRSAITIMPLSWGNNDDIFAVQSLLSNKGRTSLTHIVCSDLVYFPDLLAPLLRSLLHLTSLNFGGRQTENTPSVVISYKLRSLVKETPFWSAFGLWFNFYPILTRRKSGDMWKRFGSDFDDTTLIFTARRRPESYGWDIPHSDKDLLAGFGAQGTNTSKGDDTMEALLFMSLDE